VELAPASMQPAQVQPVNVLLITVKQAAEILGVSKQTIWALIRSGEIATVKVTGTATRVWLDDLKAYAQRRTRRAYGSGKQPE